MESVVTPREARSIAKTMFREVAKLPPRLPSGCDNPEFFERAAVLADVVLQSDRPDVMGESRVLRIGEALALAVRGRVTHYSGRFSRLGVGAQLPPGQEATELANTIELAHQAMFPSRRGPCMPNAKELRQLVQNQHGTGREAERQLRRLNAALRETCGYSSYSMQHLERVMAIANDVIGGFGVERAAYELDRRGGEDRVADFYYVNMGDAYNPTLVISTLGPRHDQFYIATWGDEVERIERRFGEGGMWRV